MVVINQILRIPLKLVEISELVKDEEFKVFAEPANDNNSRVVALKNSGEETLYQRPN